MLNRMGRKAVLTEPDFARLVANALVPVRKAVSYTVEGFQSPGQQVAAAVAAAQNYRSDEYREGGIWRFPSNVHVILAERRMKRGLWS